MIISKLKYIFSILFICLLLQAKAQQTLVHSDKYKDYKIAQELFDKGKFSSSQAYFKQIIDEVSDKQDEVRINSESIKNVLYKHNLNLHKISSFLN